MKLNFYTKFSLAFMVCTLVFSTFSKAQNQGLYADTTLWTSSTTATVKIKAKSFTNVMGFQGTITFDKNTLQLLGAPAGSAALGAANFTFGTGSAAQGIITYLYADPAANHSLADGSDVITINFTVINNPVSTYNNNVVAFANTPTQIGIDTAADVAGLTDLATLSSPNIERHTAGFVSFARPPFLTYNGTNVTDTITNRPAGSTYQWTLNGGNVTGTSISSYNNAPAGIVCLTVTYPNGNSVNCMNTITPVTLISFTGKIENGKAILNWATENEINNKGFDIEKSVDGRIFNKVGFVNSSAGTGAHQYSFSNELSGNVAWYRLKQIDNNGKFVYSNVIKVQQNVKGSTYFYPNPTKDVVNIVGNGIQNITVTNSLGKIVLQQKENLTNNAQLNMAAYSKGLYFVTVNTATDTQVLKLMLQ